MLKAIYIFIAIAIIAGVTSLFISKPVIAPAVDGIACTMDAMMCSDGTYVGRTGPNCEFVCPDSAEVPKDDQVQADDKSNLIKVTSPEANSVVSSPLGIIGEARGNWFFEASFPVILVNWDGVVIAQGVATANGDWMTEEFVPYTAELEFVNPYQVGDPDFMKKATLILQKDNPSGLPEHDNALEIPLLFAQ